MELPNYYNPSPPPSKLPPTYINTSPNQGQSQDQAQGQATVIVQPRPVYVYQPVPVSVGYYGHRAFACFVFWCCFALFGGIAWGLALAAQSEAREGHLDEAKNYGYASATLSVIGFLAGCAIWIFLFLWLWCWYCFHSYPYYGK